MAARRPRATTSGPSRSQGQSTMAEALTRLGITPEQFQAKQAELLTGLLQSEPFVPQATGTRQAALCDRSKVGEISGARSRSSSPSSSSSRALSPVLPRTPMKPEPVVPPRPRDKMEMIIESRNKLKATQRRGSTSRSRDDERVLRTPDHSSSRTQDTDLPPHTPHHYKYYSERVVGSASSSKVTLDAGNAPETPSRGRDRGRFKVPFPRGSIPKTPSRRIHGSSQPATPRSSPPPAINLVSSPGPMPANPPEEEHLPFVLPPGPYSTAKPDLSYAAMIGRAILASSQHALALQDIYEYITTVFPHYKRGETTWMNSVRHALSTMAVFRKMPRGRAEGKSLWAIHDCDVPCFDGGGFKKSLCADMNSSTAGSKGSRKRSAEEGGGPRSKRKKVSEDPPTVAMPSPMLPPFFQYANSNPHHQPYYQAAFMQQQVPADMFPPLPPSSNYHRVVARTASIPVLETLSEASSDRGTEPDHDDDIIPPSSPIERPPSSSSLPDLDHVSALSTSSSPSPSTHASLRENNSRDVSPAVASQSVPTMDLPANADDDTIAAWLQSDADSLLPTSPISPRQSSASKDKGKDKVRFTPGRSAKKHLTMMLPPSSPSPSGRARRHSGSSLNPPLTGVISDAATRPSTPPQHLADVAEVMRIMEQATHKRSVRHAATSQAIAHLEANLSERPTTPVRNQPATPSLPSTPLRLDQLESELFNFSPHKSPAGDLFTTVAHSPSLSVFTSRAPLLHMGGMDDLLSSETFPSSFRTPGSLPKTPKKSPFGLGGSSSSHPLPRMTSPFGTPSRMGPKRSPRDFDDDFSRYLQSPSSFGDMFSGLPGLNNSPSAHDHW